MPSTILRNTGVLITICLMPRPIEATEFFLTPTGAGNKDGSSWEHAFDQQALASVVNETMRPGDQLSIGSGTYQDVQLSISEGGLEGRPKTICGVDRGEGLPIFSSTWSEDKADKGPTMIRINRGATHIVLQRLRIQNYKTCVLAPAGKDELNCQQLVFNDVDMKNFRHGFYLSDCDDLQLKNCDLHRYTKHAFRFEQGCNRVTVRQCTADCSEGDAEWETKTELFPFGFLVNNGGAANSELLFEDCLARNNRMPLQKKRYKNGDGFVVEGNSSDVRFVRCRAIRNQDGGFDLKVRDVELTDCVAIGNSRNIRIWTTATLKNCFSGWASCGLWCNGGPITIHRSTFHNLQKAAVQTDDRAREPVTLNECLISSCAAVHRKTSRGKVVANETVVVDASGQSPNYLRPGPDWDGLGDSFNSQAFPDRGYRQTPADSSSPPNASR